MSEPQVYDRTTRRLHWWTAALVAVIWIIGQTADWIPDGPLNTNYWSVHIVLGSALAFVLIWRVIWRLNRRYELVPLDTGILRNIARALHFALYIVLFVVVGIGILNAFVRGYNLFDIFSLPQIGDKELRKPITQWHGFIANVLLGLAAFHAVAALLHQYVWRDGLLRRMLPPGGQTVADTRRMHD